MTVERILQRDVDVATVDLTIRAAAQRMGARSVGSLVVVDGKNRPVGILTDRDIAVRVAGEGRPPESTTVGEVMTSALRAIRMSTPIQDALEIMRAETVRRLPVVDEKRRLVGVATLDDVLVDMARDFERIRALLERESPRALVAP